MTTYAEIHRAIVKDVDDPQQRGRIRVASASLMGVDANGEALDYPEFVEPKFPVLFGDEQMTAGWFAIPSPGAMVELEISRGSTFDQTPGQTEITDPNPRWRACMLRSGDSIAPEFRTNYPLRSGIKTASGHTLIFDDAELPGQGDVFLRHRDGAQVKLAANGDISLKDSTPVGGVVLKISNGKITIGRTGIEVFALIDQLLTALVAFSSATSAAAVEPTLAPASGTLNTAVNVIKQLLAQIRG